MLNLYNEPRVLLIGGAKRNVGKTALTCRLIEKFSVEYEIVGLKIKTIYNNDLKDHGKSSRKEFNEYLIDEEVDINSTEDTGKMLRNGAHRAFIIRSKIEFLNKAVTDFLSKLSLNNFIICESNSLRKVLVPGLYLFIKDHHDDDMKKSARELEPLSDRIVLTNGINHNLNLSEIQIMNNCWVLSDNSL